MLLRDHGRYPYAAIEGRPDFSWPGAKRLAVYIALNLEHYAFGEGLRENLVEGGHEPDVLNYAWLDYGNRVGAWRLKALLEGLGLPVTLLVNAALYDHAPELIAAFRRGGHEIACHGRTNSEAQGLLAEPNEAALIAEATATLTRHEGARPRGWLGPWLSESSLTPDLLKEAGYDYLLDWCHDDQPVPLATRAGPILAVPYPQEINDSAAIIGRRVSAPDFATMMIDQFDEMLEQSAGQPLVYAVALHANIAGQPFRLRALRRALAHIAARRDEVWLTTAGGVAAHFAGL